MSVLAKTGRGSADYVDQRLGSAGFVKRSMKKVFPDHWSFMLGEIALYSFLVLLLTGVFLTFFFKPSMTEVVYDGSYESLQGITMSEAYASTLHITFDVRGGLVIRQIHHWAALIFVAAISIHMLRVFFTGGFRKPREFNWILGVGLLVLALLEGFAGYSLPDDLLSGTGLRIAQGVMLSIPVIGTYASFFVFGGEFPGEDFIPRLYTIHVLLVPGIMLALITAHIMLVWYQKHTQYPGPGRTERNVVGYPFFPVYTAKAGGFFFVVFGVTALLGGFAQINPIQFYGPYNPSQVTAGSQPDWYIGFLEGGLRMMPNWEVSALGHTLSLNVLIPAVVVPGALFTLLALYPFIEAWITGDKREHHILDRPRNHPVRTGFGVSALTFYGILWLNGGNDIIATEFHLSINSITWAARVAIIVLPPVAFIITKRICLGLQHRDHDKLLHGRATGVTWRDPSGGLHSGHEPISAEERWVIASREVPRPLELPEARDEHGVPVRHSRAARVRAGLSRFYFKDTVALPSPEQLAAQHRAAVEGGHEPEEAGRPDEVPSGTH